MKGFFSFLLFYVAFNTRHLSHIDKRRLLQSSILLYVFLFVILLDMAHLSFGVLAAGHRCNTMDKNIQKMAKLTLMKLMTMQIMVSLTRTKKTLLIMLKTIVCGSRSRHELCATKYIKTSLDHVPRLLQEWITHVATTIT